jgi:microsomal epoxide hydrolase
LGNRCQEVCRGPRSFVNHADDAVLAGLHARLERVRSPDEPPDACWRYGIDLAFMKGLFAYWRDGYDWRAQEAAFLVGPR